jgi:hypothetical protein
MVILLVGWVQLGSFRGKIFPISSIWVGHGWIKASLQTPSKSASLEVNLIIYPILNDDWIETNQIRNCYVISD